MVFLSLSHWSCINLAIYPVVICRCSPSCVAAPECVPQEKTASSSGKRGQGAPLGGFPYNNWSIATAHHATCNLAVSSPALNRFTFHAPASSYVAFLDSDQCRGKQILLLKADTSGAWWETRSGHRWFILHFNIPDKVSSSVSVMWISKMDEGVSSSLPDRRELELFQVLTASSRHCGPPAAFESFDWMLV